MYRKVAITLILGFFCSGGFHTAALARSTRYAKFQFLPPPAQRELAATNSERRKLAATQ